MNFIDHISLLDIKDGKVLLCVSRGKTQWQLPGGKRELGESDEQALIRECREELGVEIIPDTIKLSESINGQAFGKDQGVVVNVKIFTANFTGEIIPGSEVEQAKYFSFADVPDTSELGWEYLKKLKSNNQII